MVWYGIVEFNVPLDTVQVISETTTLSSDVHLPFSNGGPATYYFYSGKGSGEEGILSGVVPVYIYCPAFNVSVSLGV